MTDSLQLGFAGLARSATRAEYQALIAKLVEIAQGLARVRPEGVTVADVRHEAIHQCLVLPAKPHFLGAVMQRAGLVATDEFRRSDIAQSHGNAQRLWRRPGAG